MLSKDWNSVLLSNDVTKAWDCFRNVLMSAINSLAPVKQARIKQRTEPLIYSDILALINQRNTAFEQYEQRKTEEDLNIFRSLKNKAQITISKAKQNFFYREA